MPKLDTTLHVDMLSESKKKRRFERLRRVLKAVRAPNDLYGLQWGDPEVVPPLKYVREHFLRPYVSADATVVEIGPGGGRWTRYLLQAKKVYAVDYHGELLSELRSNVASSKLVTIKNNGDDFPGVPPGSVDFVFSFGTFVHLDVELIDRYLKNIRPLLKPTSNVVIHYSDKTKPIAQSNETFSDNDPEKMRRLVLAHGYEILEEDTKSMWHSSLVRFGAGKAV